MNHDELIESIPLLAIDALSEAERDEVRQHIAQCPSCARLLAEYERVGVALLQNVPPVALPPQLAMGIRGRVGALQAASLKPRVPQPVARNIWQKPLALPRWATFGAVAILLLIALMSIGGLVISQSNQASRARGGDDTEIVRLLQTAGTTSINIKGTDGAPTAMGQVILNPESARAYLIIHNLTPLSADQTYQVWLVRDGQRDSAGTFSVDSQGHATARIWAPKPWSAYQEIGVTLEPARGSQWPTTPRLIGGKLSQ